jgi:hypothetical protein
MSLKHTADTSVAQALNCNLALQDAATHSNTKPAAEPKAGDWKIEVGTSPVMWGDENTRIIFFNLNGRNFESPEPWRQQTHSEYLDYMNSVFPGAFLPGQTIRLVDPEGSVVGEHTFCGAEALPASPSANTEVDSATLPLAADGESDDWVPAYSKWRHGGWYVLNVRYPNGGSGCVSNNYPDKKWRIACDSRRKELGEEGDFTYPTRDAAARAERALVGW